MKIEEMDTEQQKKTAGQNLFLDHPKSPKMCNFRGFFELFSKNRMKILPLKRQNKEEMDSEHFAKNRRSNPFQKVEISCAQGYYSPLQWRS